MSNKPKLQSETRHFFTCTNCDDQTKHRVDHILKVAMSHGRVQSFGPWACRSCQMQYSGVITPYGQMDVTQMEAPAVPMDKCYVLLRHQPEAGIEPLVVILNTHLSRDLRQNPDHLSYFYDEHTCPKNWLREVEVLSWGEDPDPHGLFEFVAVLTPEQVVQTLNEPHTVGSVVQLEMLQGGERDDALIKAFNIHLSGTTPRQLADMPAGSTSTH